MSDIEMKAKFKQWYLTKAPKQFKQMFAKTTEDEGIMLEICFHQFAEMVANGVNTSDIGLHLQRVSVSESDIDAMFPYEDIETARPTRPENRIRAYNSRQADRREGAKRLFEKLHSR